MKVLITRSREDATPLAALLAAHDIETLIDPMLEIELQAGPPLDLEDVQALLMTSANGVRAFCQRNQERSLAVLAVGDATAREAMTQGFSDVSTAAGDVTALAGLVKGRLSADKGYLLHVAGTHTAGDLAGALTEAGFKYRREVLYKASARQTLDPKTVSQLKNNQLDGVLLYSPRTAKIFCECVRASECASDIANITAYCLSPAVAGALEDLQWRSIETADKPTQKDILRIVADRI